MDLGSSMSLTRIDFILINAEYGIGAKNFYWITVSVLSNIKLCFISSHLKCEVQGLIKYHMRECQSLRSTGKH